MRISEGREARGEYGAGEASVGGGEAGIGRSPKDRIRAAVVVGASRVPSWEWWAVLGTVTEAFEGLTFAGFEEDDETWRALDGG